MRKINMMTAKAEAVREEMERDERVILVGQDVYETGGIFEQYRSFGQKFGKERVIQTTLNESGHATFSVGAAIGGLRPIVEFNIAEFSSFAMSAIVNEAAKQRGMTYGAVKIPIVFCMSQGGGFGTGGMHATVADSWFTNTSGLKVYVPYYPADIKGLMKYAIHEDDPVVFLDHKDFGVTGEVPDLEVDHIVEPGKANILKEGTDVTIVSYQRGVFNAMKAYDDIVKLGIYPEIIDLRTLVPLDKETIINSVKKTGRLLVVTESRKLGGFGNNVVTAVVENAFESLKGSHPIHYVSSKDYVPFYGVGEKHVLIQPDEIVKAVKKVM